MICRRAMELTLERKGEKAEMDKMRIEPELNSEEAIGEDALIGPDKGSVLKNSRMAAMLSR